MKFQSNGLFQAKGQSRLLGNPAKDHTPPQQQRQGVLLRLP